MTMDYEQGAAIFKALANPTRLRIVRGLLHCGCRNVSCIEEKTGMRQSCISQHLQKLRAAGIVTAERSGNEVYYHVSSPQTAQLIAVMFGEEGQDDAL